MQGMPKRVSNRRRHGEDEDRIPSPVAPTASDLHSGKAHRVPAAIRAGRKPHRSASQPSQQSPGPAVLGERLSGISAKRKLPTWRRDIYRTPTSTKRESEVLLFVDCFSRYFEPENARAARTVLEAAGYTVMEDTSPRPLCCGRTFLSAGLVREAREELTRLVAALDSRAKTGTPIVG